MLYINAEITKPYALMTDQSRPITLKPNSVQSNERIKICRQHFFYVGFPRGHLLTNREAEETVRSERDGPVRARRSGGRGRRRKPPPCQGDPPGAPPPVTRAQAMSAVPGCNCHTEYHPRSSRYVVGLLRAGGGIPPPEVKPPAPGGAIT